MTHNTPETNAVPKTLVVLGINQRRVLVPLDEAANAGLVELVLMDWDTQEEHLLPLTTEQAALLQSFYVEGAEERAEAAYGETEEGTGDVAEQPAGGGPRDRAGDEEFVEGAVPAGSHAFLGTVAVF